MTKAMSTLETGLQQHPVTKVFFHPHWHNAEPAPHHLCGLNNWLGILIGFPLPHRKGVFHFLVYSTALSLSLHNVITQREDREGEESC